MVTGSVVSPLTGTLTIQNTIVASHTVGLIAIVGNLINADYTLLFGNGLDSFPGPVSLTNSVTGDPKFAADGYHLLAGSAAGAAGTTNTVTTDIDGMTRPSGKPTIGAVERNPASKRYAFLPSMIR